MDAQKLYGNRSPKSTAAKPQVLLRQSDKSSLRPDGTRPKPSMTVSHDTSNAWLRGTAGVMNANWDGGKKHRR